MKKTGFTTKKLLLWVVAFLVFLSVMVIIYHKTTTDGKENLSGSSQKGQETIPVELFILAPCESCHEDDKFLQEVLSQLDKSGFENPDCTVYNVYKDSGAAHFNKIIETHQLELTLANLPAAVVNGTVYRGTYQEIGEAVAQYLETGVSDGQPDSVSGFDKTAANPESNALDFGTDTEADSDEDTTQMPETLADSAFYHELQTVEESDTTLVLFVTGSCESCQTAEAYLQNDLSNEKFDLLIYNILEDENALVLRRLFALYGVPESGQQVPLLFSPETYLSGAEAIVNGTEEMLEAGKAAETSSEGPASEGQTPVDIEAKPEITYEDFARLQFQVGEIIACEAVPKSKKLLCSQVKIGSQVRQIVSGIKAHYTPEEMVGKKVMVLVNLKPATLAGVVSEGMLLCAEDAHGNLALMTAEKPMPSGAEIC